MEIKLIKIKYSTSRFDITYNIYFDQEECEFLKKISDYKHGNFITIKFITNSIDPFISMLESHDDDHIETICLEMFSDIDIEPTSIRNIIHGDIKERISRLLLLFKKRIGLIKKLTESKHKKYILERKHSQFLISVRNMIKYSKENNIDIVEYIKEEKDKDIIKDILE